MFGFRISFVCVFVFCFVGWLVLSYFSVYAFRWSLVVTCCKGVVIYVVYVFASLCICVYFDCVYIYIYIYIHI